MKKNKFLETRNLCKTYSGRAVVDGLSFYVGRGEIVGLLGPNGAGKTTAFYMTMGLIKADSGSVLFEGEDITHTPIHVRAQKGMGYLAQEPSVFKTLTVEENILCVLEQVCPSPQKRKKRLEELLNELHLTRLAKEKAYALSGGERRRLEITRALVTNPRFLLLDEPFANIDPISIYDVKQIIKILSEKGISVLITDHNAREIFSVCDRSYLIRNGKVMLSGSVEELVNDEEAKKAYFGTNFEI